MKRILSARLFCPPSYESLGLFGRWRSLYSGVKNLPPRRLLTQLEKPTSPLFANLGDLEEQARQHLDQASYDFVAGGAGAERTLRANLEAFQKITIMPRVLTGIKEVDTSLNLLGQRLSMPSYVTRLANHSLFRPVSE